MDADGLDALNFPFVFCLLFPFLAGKNAVEKSPRRDDDSLNPLLPRFSLLSSLPRALVFLISAD